jgi:hypothetical protein
MSSDQKLAAGAIKRIAEIWQVDKARTAWSANGFDWWPGDFRVRVRAEPARGRICGNPAKQAFLIYSEVRSIIV